jgi:hypothetical protein
MRGTRGDAGGVMVSCLLCGIVDPEVMDAVQDGLSAEPLRLMMEVGGSTNPQGVVWWRGGEKRWRHR